MKKEIIGKKGNTLILTQLMPLIIIIIFTAIMASYIVLNGTGSLLKERIYSKNIALLIDKSSSDMLIEMDIKELNDKAKTNKFNGPVVKIDNINNLVEVSVISGKSEKYRFFLDKDISYNIKEDKLILAIS